MVVGGPMTTHLATSGPTARQRAAILRGNLERIPEGPMRGRLSARLAELLAEMEEEVAHEEPFLSYTPDSALGDEEAQRLCRHYDLGWQEGWDDAMAYVKGQLILPPERREIWLPEFRQPQRPNVVLQPSGRPVSRIRPTLARR